LQFLDCRLKSLIPLGPRTVVYFLVEKEPAVGRLHPTPPFSERNALRIKRLYAGRRVLGGKNSNKSMNEFEKEARKAGAGRQRCGSGRNGARWSGWDDAAAPE